VSVVPVRLSCWRYSYCASGDNEYRRESVDSGDDDARYNCYEDGGESDGAVDKAKDAGEDDEAELRTDGVRYAWDGVAVVEGYGQSENDDGEEDLVQFSRALCRCSLSFDVYH